MNEANEHKINSKINFVLYLNKNTKLERSPRSPSFAAHETLTNRYL